jgi:hypothetical protein
VREQKRTLLTNSAIELASITRDNKGVAFLIFPGNEQYQQTTRELFPGGKNGEVTSRRGTSSIHTSSRHLKHRRPRNSTSLWLDLTIARDYNWADAIRFSATRASAIGIRFGSSGFCFGRLREF